MSGLRKTLRAGYRLIVGGGNPSLLLRKQYHEGWHKAAETVLREAKSRPEMFVPVYCPACGGSDVRSTFSSGPGLPYSECAIDGTVYMNPAPTLETLGRIYNDDSYSTHRSSGHSAQPVDCERVAKLAQPDRRSRLLDVGCAAGDFLEIVKSKFECSGVEINAELAQKARDKGFEVTTGVLADIPGENRFDVISMLQVIEHLVTPVEPLADVYRLLRPGGTFYLDTPCVDSASFKLLRERHNHVISFGHVSLFTRAGLQKLAERTGFVMSAHGYCGGSDLELHDLLGWRFARSRFRHRVAFYSQRFQSFSRLLDTFTFGVLAGAMRPAGNESYQWAEFTKPE